MKYINRLKEILRQVSLWDGGVVAVRNQAGQENFVDNILGLTAETLQLQKLEAASTDPATFLQHRRNALVDIADTAKARFIAKYAEYRANPYELSEHQARDLAINVAATEYTANRAVIEARYPASFGGIAVCKAASLQRAIPAIQSAAIIEDDGSYPNVQQVARSSRLSRHRTRRHKTRRHRK